MEVNDIIQIISLSLIVTTTATMIAMIIAIVLSIVIYLKNFRFKKYIITFVNALMSTPPVIMGLLVFLMLSRQGPLGEFKLLFTPVAMIIAQTML